MTQSEYNAATVALVNWFKSQGISKMDSGIVISNFLASQMVTAGISQERMYEGIDTFTTMTKGMINIMLDYKRKNG